MAAKIPFARGLSLPLDAVTETFAFIGRRGSGKTYGAGVLVEGMLDANAQVVILDPIGVWYGLRAGKQPFNIPVLGGAHGDIPLVKTAGPLIADVIIDRGTSAVLDVSSFRKNARKQFITQFAERFFQRKKTKRSAVHIVLEEAHVFAPQRVHHGGEEMLGAIEDIVRLGRNFGIGATLITQRPQSVNKDVLNQVEALVVFQTTGSHERKAIQNWIVHQGIDTHELVDQLPSLQQGTAYFWSPAWLESLKKVHIRKKRSADTSATPKAGKRVGKPKVKSLGSTDLDQLRDAMAATVDEAKQNDPKALQAEIAKLKRELKKTPAVAPKEVRVEVPVITTAQTTTLRTLADNLEEAAAEASKAAETIKNTLSAVEEHSRKPAPGRAADVSKAKPPASGSPGSSVQLNSNGKLRAGAMRMLEALAAFYPAKMSKKQLASAAKLKSKSGTFSAYWRELKSGSFIEEHGDDEWSITELGFALLGYEAPSLPDTLEARMQYWMKRLRRGERRMLHLLRHTKNFGPLTREEIADRLSLAVNSGTFSAYLGTLRRNRLIDQTGDGYRLGEWLING